MTNKEIGEMFLEKLGHAIREAVRDRIRRDFALSDDDYQNIARDLIEKMFQERVVNNYYSSGGGNA